MEIRKSLLLGTWILLILNLILAGGTVALLSRMSPAIAKIISENDKSLAACENMLTVLALINKQELADNDKKRFYDAVSIAEKAITEHEETAVLAEIRHNADMALKGDSSAITDEINSIKKLTDINRRAMKRADINARRLGIAGAWGAVFLACISFISGLIFIRHLNRHILLPLDELYNVLKAQKKGDSFRHCVKGKTSAFFYFIYDEINSLIDRQISKK